MTTDKLPVAAQSDSLSKTADQYRMFAAATLLLEEMAAAGASDSLLHHLRDHDRQTLMQWGSPKIDHLLLVGAGGSLLTRLPCSPNRADVLLDILTTAEETHDRLRAYVCNPGRDIAIEEISLSEFRHVISEQLPWSLTAASPTSGVVLQDQRVVATWSVCQGDASARLLLPVDAAEVRGSETARLVTHLSSAIMPPTKVLDIVTTGHGDAHLSHELAGALLNLAPEMIAMHAGAPMVRTEVRINGSSHEELVRQLAPASASWQSLARQIALDAGPASDADAAYRAAEARIIEDGLVVGSFDDIWLQICEAHCPGLRQADRPADERPRFH